MFLILRENQFQLGSRVLSCFVNSEIVAYRMLIPMEQFTCIPGLAEIMDPTDAFTTMIMGHDCRIVMGPARNGKVYGDYSSCAIWILCQIG